MKYIKALALFALPFCAVFLLLDEPPAPSVVYGGNPSAGRILESKGFCLSYSETRKNPLWVHYRLFAIENPISGKRPGRFKVDPRSPSVVAHDDYTNSGYDRGHMAPNYAIATRYGSQGQSDTFVMTNIVPQKPNLNRQIWRMLEQKVARGYANDLEEVWIITGPIFDESVEKLESGVEIPDAFYKIIADELDGKVRTLSFIMDQYASGDLKKYLVSVDAIEEKTHLDFFSEFYLDETVVGEMW